MNQESVKHEPTIQDPNLQQLGGGAPEVKEELSKVAISPKRNFIVFASMAIGFGVMAYNLIAPQLFGETKKPDPDQVERPENVVKPAAQAADTTPAIPKLPEPPKLIAPTPPEEPKLPVLPNVPVEPPIPAGPAPLPPAPVNPTAEAGTTIIPPGAVGSSAEDTKKRLEAKRKAPIHLLGGGNKTGGGKDIKKTASEEQQSADFKKRGDLNYVLGQGKIIDVITETAINSDFPGEVRAVVTRDVFSESGKVILIPKGTRVFGAFTANSTGGYGRISIKWTRIDLDSGYTLNLAGDAVDNLGRAGVQGVVDNKYTEQMANALLTSAFSIGVAAGLDKLVPPVQSTQGGANTNLAVNMQNTAASIYNDAVLTDKMSTIDGENIVINNLCSTIQGMITDKTVTAYTTIIQACSTALTTTNSQPTERAKALVASITGAATSIASSTAAAAVPTQKQLASQQAFKDLSGTMQDMVKQQTFTPTTTVDQGHPIKIYVSKDYYFPKDAVIKSKVLQ
jgi:type IV secretion system protein VirB10